jgi:uridine phosphorylase
MGAEKRFLPLLKVEADQIKAKALVCGDPARAAKIAAKLDKAEEMSCNREYIVFNGEKDGIEMTVASHGVGASGATVCFEEIIKGGAKEIIRVGTAGSLRRDISDGDIVLATGAVREDGMTNQLVPAAYPAVAGYKLLGKLEKAGVELGIPSYSGFVLTVAAFYPELLELPNNLYSKANVIAVEMEVSALFVIASLHRVAAGAVLAIDGMAIDFDADSYNPHRDLVDMTIEKTIELGIRALAS